MGITTSVQRRYLSVDDISQLIKIAPIYIQSDDRVWTSEERDMLLNFFQVIRNAELSSSTLQKVRLSVARFLSSQTIEKFDYSSYVYTLVGMMWSLYQHKDITSVLYTTNLLSEIYPNASDQNSFIEAVRKVYFVDSDILIPENSLVIPLVPFALIQGTLIEYTPQNSDNYFGEIIRSFQSSQSSQSSQSFQSFQSSHIDKGVYIVKNTAIVHASINSMILTQIGHPHECLSNQSTSNSDNSKEIYKLCRPKRCYRKGRCPTTLFEYLDEILYYLDIQHSS